MKFEQTQEKESVLKKNGENCIVNYCNRFLWYMQELTFISKKSIIAFVVRNGGKECGRIAQLGEHLPYKQRVIGSSPIGPIFIIIS